METVRDALEKNLRRLFRTEAGQNARRRWGCLKDEEIAAFADRRVAARERQQMEAHLEKCSFCREQVAFLARTNEVAVPESVPAAWLARAGALADSRGSKGARWWWRWQTVAAAAACLVLVSVVTLRRAHQETPSAPAPGMASSSNVRGVGGLALIPELIWPVPGAVVSARGLEFRWKPVAGAMEYQISVVTASGDLVWEQKMEGTSVRLPGSVSLSPGQKYFVWIRAYMQGGKEVRSKAVPFVVV
jgi:hypothetical protein